ncbi:MAG: hypothetical protein WC621_02095 [Patescibacteria group bacterium]
MFDDINLLPNDLRERERKIKQAITPSASPTEYSKPKFKAVEPSGGKALTWWQRLLQRWIKKARPIQPVFGPTNQASAKIAKEAEVVATAKSAAAAVEPIKTSLAAPALGARPDNEGDKANGSFKSPEPIPAYQNSQNHYVAKGVPSDKIKGEAVAKVDGSLPKLVGRSTLSIPPVLPGLSQPAAAGAAGSELVDVNLIPFSQRVQPSGPAKRLVAAVWLASLAAVAVVYGLSNFYLLQRQSAFDKAQTDINARQQQLENLRQQSETNLSLGTRLQTVSDLLAVKKSWLPLFNWLEKNSVVAVYFTSFAADSSGKLALQGRGENYTEVMRQMRAFELAPEVLDVQVSNLQQISGAGGEAAGVAFSLALTFKPVIFNPAPVNP